MGEVTPIQTFEPGQLLKVYTEDVDPVTDARTERALTVARVIDFDPTTSTYKPSGGSKARSPMPDHWHVAVLEPDTGEWLPAAVDDHSCTLGKHFKVTHMVHMDLGLPLQYTPEDFDKRVGALVCATTSVRP